jgi:hypothetical protein
VLLQYVLIGKGECVCHFNQDTQTNNPDKLVLDALSGSQIEAATTQSELTVEAV